MIAEMINVATSFVVTKEDTVSSWTFDKVNMVSSLRTFDKVNISTNRSPTVIVVTLFSCKIQDKHMGMYVLHGKQTKHYWNSFYKNRII